MNTSCLGCGRIIPTATGGRCGDCKPKRVRPQGQGKHYRTRAWAQTRRQAITKAQGQCQHCGTTSDLHVHHLTPRADGGTDDPANLQVLCRSCHGRETMREQQARNKAL